MDDTQWLEATQAMDDDVQNEEKDEKILMAWLEVSGRRHEVFTGENRIGRDPSACEIVLESKTLSKKHAVLEIDGETHLIADLNSMNKTRIGKAYLKPHVRYALQGGENLKFGDVHAIYIIKSQMISDSDSETGSESFLEPTQPMPPSPPSPRSAWSPVMSQSLCADLEEEEDDSFINPTPVPTVPSNATTLLFAGRQNTAYIPETPINDRLHGPGIGTSIIPESPTPSECTPNLTKTRQAFVLESPALSDAIQSPHNTPFSNNRFDSGNTTITKNFQDDMSHMTDDEDDSFFLEPSQQSKKTSIFTNKSKSEPPVKDQDDDTGGFNSDESTDVEDIDNNVPQMQIDEEKKDLKRNDGDKLLPKNTINIGEANDRFDNRNTEIRNISEEDLIPTQVFTNIDKNVNQNTNRFKDMKKISDDLGKDMDSESDDDIATQMFDAEFSNPNKQALPKAITSKDKLNNANEIKDDIFDNPTQLFTANKSESLNTPKQGSFLLPKEADTTQDILDAFNDDDNLPTPQLVRDKQQCEVRDIDDDDDISTQMFDEPDKEISFKKPSIIPNRRDSCQDKSIDEKDIDFFFAPTQQFNEDPNKPKQGYPSSMHDEEQLAPTQQFTGTSITKRSHAARDEAICEDDDDDIDEALFDEPTQSFRPNNSKIMDVPTQKFEDDMLAPTQVFKAPSLIVRKTSVPKTEDDDDIPTQLFDDDELPPTQVFKESTSVSRVLETKTGDDDLPPTQVFKVPSTKTNRGVEVREKDDDSTQIFDEDNEDLIPTQAFKDSPKCDRLSVTVTDDDDIPTQVFDQDAVSTQHVKKTPSKTAAVKENIENEDMIPTQMFFKSPSKIVGNEDDDVPTQVFQSSPRILTDTEDMDPTQVFTNSPRITGTYEHLAPTQLFSRNLSKENEDSENAATQVFPKTPSKDFKTCDGRNDVPTNIGENEDSEEDIPTQVFHKSPSKENVTSGDRKYTGNNSKENEDTEDIPTQIFPMSPHTQVFPKESSESLAKDADSSLKRGVIEDAECTQEFDVTQDIGIEIPVGVAKAQVPRESETISNITTSNQQKDIVVDDDDENSNASETLLADQEELVSQSKDQESKNLEAEHYNSDESTDIDEFEVIPESKKATMIDKEMVKSNIETLKCAEGSEKQYAGLSHLKHDSEILSKEMKKNNLSPDIVNKSNISRLEISTDSDINQSIKGNETANNSSLNLSSDSTLPVYEEVVAGSSKTLHIADSTLNKTENKKLHNPNFIRIIKPVDNILSSVSSMNDFVHSSESTQGSVAGLGDISLSNIIYADSEDVTEDVTTQDMLDEPVYKAEKIGLQDLKTPPKKSHISSEDTDSESDDQLSSSLRLFDIPPEESPQKSPVKAKSKQKSPRKLVSPKKKSKDISEDSTSEDEEQDRKITIASPVRRRSRRERNNDKGKSSKSTDEEVEIEHKVVGRNVARRGKKNKSEQKNSFADDDTGHSSKNHDNSKKDEETEIRKKNTVRKKNDDTDKKNKNELEGKILQDITEKKGKAKRNLKKSDTENDESSNIKAEIKVGLKSSSRKLSELKESKKKSPVKKIENDTNDTEEKQTTTRRKRKKIFDSESDDDSDESVLSDYKGTSNKKIKSHIESTKKNVKGKVEVPEEDDMSGKRKANKRKSIDAELSDEVPSKNVKRHSKRNDQSQNETCVTLDDVTKPPLRRGRRRMSETSSASTVSNSNQRASTRKSLANIEKPNIRGQGKQMVAHESDSSTSEVPKRGRGRSSAVHDSETSTAELPRRSRGNKADMHESESSTSEVSKKKQVRKSNIQGNESDITDIPKKGQGKSVTNVSDNSAIEVSKKGRGRQSNVHEMENKKDNRKSLVSETVDKDENSEPRRGSRIHREPQKYSPSKNDKEETKKEVIRKGRKSDVKKSSISPAEKSKESLEIKEIQIKSKKVGNKKVIREAVEKESESDSNSDDEATEIIEPRKSRGRASMAPSEKIVNKSKKNSEPVSEKSEEPSSRNRKKGNNSQEIKTSTKGMKTDVPKKSNKRQSIEPSTSDGSLKRSSSQSSLDSQASNRNKRSRVTEENLSTPKSRTSGSSRGSPYSGESVLWSPSHRHQLANTRPKVMFTSYTDAGDEKIVTSLGGTVVEDPHECTVLVTTSIRRTCKLIAALGGGRPIVTPKWLAASKQARNFTDPWSYLVVDKEAEKKFGFRLEKTLKSASSNPLFNGYSIFVTKNVKPPPDQMKEIIACSGGEFLESAPKSAHEKVLVVSCEDDKRQWGSFKKNNIPVVSFEFVLTGLLRQKILIEDYKLI